ncbi:MAG: tetratricopeptide repeat protein [Bacteroidota bacterium]
MIKINTSLYLVKTLVISLLIIGFVNISFAQITSDKEATALEQKLTKQSYTDKIQSYQKLISFYSKTALEKAQVFSNKLIAEAKAQNDKRTVADGLNLLGRTNIRMGKFNEAKPIHMEALFVYKSLGNDTGVAAQYGNLGVIFEMSGDFPKALLFYQRALKIYEQLNDTKSIAFAENNIGIVYQEMNLFDLSLAFQQKAFRHKQQLKDTSGMASTLNNIGVIYESLKLDFNKALIYYKQALTLYEKLGNNLQIATLLNNIGLIYLKQNNLPDAEVNLTNAFIIRKSLNDKHGEASSLLNLAQLALKQSKPTDAIEKVSKSIALYLVIGSKTKLSEGYQTLAQAYEKTNNYQQALNGYKNYVAYRDTIYNENNQKSIHEMQAKYDYDVNQKQLVILEKDNELKSKQLSKNRWILINLLIVFILTIALVIFYIRQNKIKQEHLQLNTKHQLFRAQMNPHFIFNALASVQKFVIDNNKELGSSYITRFGRLMRKTLENSTREYVPLSEELEVLKDYTAFQQLRFNHKFSVQFNIDPQIECDLLEMPPMLIQPFLENAIEHGVATINNGKIEVDIKLHENHLTITITDNGVGINHNKNKKNTNHKSMAISIINERIKLLSKSKKTNKLIEITDLSEENPAQSGTKIIFEIPISDGKK